jgi:hypothetical protein
VDEEPVIDLPQARLYAKVVGLIQFFMVMFSHAVLE